MGLMEMDKLILKDPHIALPDRAAMAQVLVAHVYDVRLEEMRASTRMRPRAALARQVAMYLSHVVLKMTLKETAAAFGRDRSTASYAFHHVEELRDDPKIDRTLGWLERVLRSTVGAPQ